MKKAVFTLALLALSLLIVQANHYEELTRDFVRGKADVKSMSVLAFGPEGILFIGDSKSGKVFAVDLEDREKNTSKEPFAVEDIESKLASLLGTDPKGVIIHDLAVNPISQNAYLAVSRTDANQLGFWKLPNDLADASILLKVKADGSMEEVKLNNINHAVTDVPNVVDEGQQNWRKVDLRTEAITDMAYDDGQLYIAGLSNEEFASALRVIPFPFKKGGTYSTIEVYHVAHGKSESESPIRTLLPYEIDGKKYILASYTCTPFVSIPVESLGKEKHIVSKTLAEFGFGNMPVDIVGYTARGKAAIMMSSNSKALIRINPEDIGKQKEGLTEPLKPGEYTAGMPHHVWSVVGVTQLTNYNEDHLLALQRMPNGHLNLRTLPTKWL